ncbi:hypothetical protein D3C73_865970 [compost metagenome]
MTLQHFYQHLDLQPVTVIFMNHTVEACEAQGCMFQLRMTPKQPEHVTVIGLGKQQLVHIGNQHRHSQLAADSPDAAQLPGLIRAAAVQQAAGAMYLTAAVILHKPQQLLLQLCRKARLRRNRQNAQACCLRQPLVQHLIA